MTSQDILRAASQHQPELLPDIEVTPKGFEWLRDIAPVVTSRDTYSISDLLERGCLKRVDAITEEYGKFGTRHYMMRITEPSGTVVLIDESGGATTTYSIRGDFDLNYPS